MISCNKAKYEQSQYWAWIETKKQRRGCAGVEGKGQLSAIQESQLACGLGTGLPESEFR